MAAVSHIIGIVSGTACLRGDDPFAHDHDLFDGHDRFYRRIRLLPPEKIETKDYGKTAGRL